MTVVIPPNRGGLPTCQARRSGGHGPQPNSVVVVDNARRQPRLRTRGGVLPWFELRSTPPAGPPSRVRDRCPMFSALTAPSQRDPCLARVCPNRRPSASSPSPVTPVRPWVPGSLRRWRARGWCRSGRMMRSSSRRRGREVYGAIDLTAGHALAWPNLEWLELTVSPPGTTSTTSSTRYSTSCTSPGRAPIRSVATRSLFRWGPATP